MQKWNRDVGKPYIRRANGREQASTLREACELVSARLRWGRKGFYVMVQRKCPYSLMTVGRTKEEIKKSVLAVRRSGFAEWANRVKRMAQERGVD